jgi:hypothetical protein
LVWQQHRQQQQQQQQDDPDSSSSSSPLPVYYARLPSFNCYDVMYTGTIEVGTPSQEFHVKLDIATTVSWIPSVRCDHTCHYKFYNKYNPSISSTYQSMNVEFVEKYPHDYSASVCQ